MKSGLTIAISALIAVWGSGCAESGAPHDSTASPTTQTTTVHTSPYADGDDPGESGGAVRIPLGHSVKVAVPADAVLDIKGLQGWDKAALRCAVTDGAGQPVGLLPPPAGAEPERAAHGGTWISMWTVAAPPGELTIGCADPDSKIAESSTSFIRVVPRGMNP
ncbi:MAG: hypothetical protein ACRDUS_13205 [Mycobacterium sp.]